MVRSSNRPLMGTEQRAQYYMSRGPPLFVDFDESQDQESVKRACTKMFLRTVAHYASLCAIEIVL
jgi:hypothetical protein